MENERVLQPNHVSCMAAVAAMITEKPIQYVFNWLGHNGTDYIEEFDKERGFTIREIQAYLVAHSFMLGIYFVITNQHLLDENPFPVAVPRHHPVMLVVDSEAFPGKRHAVYWTGKVVRDPSPVSEPDRELHSYKILEWWPVTKLED